MDGRRRPPSASACDVAGRGRLAGVSIKTVSRVVNQEAGVGPTWSRSGWRRPPVSSTYRPRTSPPPICGRGRQAAALGLMLENVANPFSRIHPSGRR